MDWPGWPYWLYVRGSVGLRYFSVASRGRVVTLFRRAGCAPSKAMKLRRKLSIAEGTWGLGRRVKFE